MAKKQNPQPSPPPGITPLFGSYCRSQAYINTRTAERVHVEASLTDPQNGLWQAVRVAEDIVTHEFRTTALGKPGAFAHALEQMTQFELEAKADPRHFEYPPGPAELGFIHFRAFAEREGYVFDTANKPHARPQAGALPAEGVFSPAAIASANKNLERTPEQFDTPHMPPRTPSPHFIFDHFRESAHKKSVDGEARELRIISIFETFTTHVETALHLLESYCSNHAKETDVKKLEQAENSFNTARLCMTQIKAYGMDTQSFEKFILECKICCHVIHAQSVFARMCRSSLYHDQNEAELRATATKALSLFDLLPNYTGKPNNLEDRTNLEDMMVRISEPRVPAAIRQFIDSFHRQISAFRDNRSTKPASKPPRP